MDNVHSLTSKPKPIRLCSICGDKDNHEQNLCEDSTVARQKSQFYFTAVIRYLGVDFPEGIDKSEMRFCDKCDSILNQFGDWYKDYEMIRLFISSSVKNLGDVICQSRDQSNNREGVDADIRELRNIFLKRCSRRLLSIPRVSLEQIKSNTKWANNNRLDKIDINAELVNQEEHSLLERASTKNFEDVKLAPTDKSDVIQTEALPVHVKVEVTDFKLIPNLNIRVKENSFEICFFCLDASKSFANSDNLDFKLLLRFLGIKLSSTDALSKQECVFCEKCHSILKEFSILYQDFEISRLFMNNCIHSLYRIIKESQATPWNPMFSKVLRKEIIVKCSKKLVFTPRVRVTLKNVKSFDDNLSSGSRHADADKITIKMEPFQLLNQDQLRTTKKSEIKLATETTKPKKKRYPKKYKYRCQKGAYKPLARVNCRFCSKPFMGTSNTKIHMVVAHSYQYYSDKIPSSVTESKFDKTFQEIVSQRKMYKNRIVGCPYCSRSSRDTLIKEHILEKHFDKILRALKNPVQSSQSINPPQSFHDVKNTNNLTAVECPQCKLKFNSKISLQRHLKKHSGELACKHCSQKSTSAYQLKAHEISAHTMPILEKKLPQGTSENQLEAVIQDIWKQKESIPKGKVMCTICRKTLKVNLSNLRTHVLVHHLNVLIEKLKVSPPKQNSFRYPCLKCKRTLASSRLLRMHERGCEIKDTKKQSKCPHCQIWYCKAQLKLHKLFAHGLQHLKDKVPSGTTENNVNSVISGLMTRELGAHRGRVKSCSICQKSFSKNIMLHCHILIKHENIVKSKLSEAS